MTVLSKLKNFFLGCLWCAWKGLKLLLGLHKKDKTKDFYGLNDPKLDSEWARIGNHEPMSHTRTNIVVEWNRLDAQRGAKVFCFLIGISNLLWATVLLAIIST